MKNRIFIGLTNIIIVALLSSCGKIPQEEIDDANAAIAEAQSEEAALYVPNEFANLMDLMKSVMDDIEKQKSKVFRKYSPLKIKLDIVVKMAKKVSINAKIRKDEVMKESEKLISEVRTILVENRNLLIKIPRGKEGASVIEQIMIEMISTETIIQEAQNLFERGAYIDAYNKIKGAENRASALNTELKESIKNMVRLK